jgi:hypothetical protein
MNRILRWNDGWRVEKRCGILDDNRATDINRPHPERSEHTDYHCYTMSKESEERNPLCVASLAHTSGRRVSLRTTISV